MYCKQNAELQLIITKSTMEGNDVSSEQWEGWLADWVATASSAAWGDHLACTKTGFVNTEAAEQAHEIVEAAKKLDIDLAVRKVSRANEAFFHALTQLLPPALIKDATSSPPSFGRANSQASTAASNRAGWQHLPLFHLA